MCSYDLHRAPSVSYTSQLTLVKLIKLKKNPNCVYSEREKKREKEREKEKILDFLLEKNELPKKIKNEIKKCPGTRAQGSGALVPWTRVPI